MSVGFEEVRRIAALARLGVAEDRLPVLAKELSGILEHMAELQRVDTSGVAEDAGLAATPQRADQGPPIPLLRGPDAFAPEFRDGFFIVPRLATHGGQSATPGAGGLDEEGAGEEMP